MKQVIQDFKTGELLVDDVPHPALSRGFVLVRNHFSLISSGTERSTVSTGKASLLGKARQRPDLVKQVLDTLKREGLSETLKRVRMKLATLKELGYSSSGTVLMSMDTEGAFKPGQRVACGGGGYASHAGVVAVPQNLVVRVPDSVPLDHAAFTTLGAIAMQGVRQAAPVIGDNVCVIGLGLLGQITAQILRANGCRVFGVDVSLPMVELAARHGCRTALTRDNSDLQSTITAFTEGHGFDSVIITAATQSNDPVDFATTVLRQKGTVVIVGAVPMNIPREPHFYRKELSLKISCSYGPGRYDYSYEEDGHDYPYGYVRWTENRNMQAFVKLIEDGAVDVAPLITHVFDVDDAIKAYDIVTGKVHERHIAMLLRYSETAEQAVIRHAIPTPSLAATLPTIAFIGAGSFAQKFLIPYATSAGTLHTVVTSHGVTAKNVGNKFGFSQFSTNPDDVFSNRAINTVFIATRHNTHAVFVEAALRAGKNVFVEKPLALDEGDLPGIVSAAERRAECRLMVGFNRRFSPLAREAKRVFECLSEPIVIHYRINAGPIPRGHWIQTQEGGGRILGEVCHFVDLMQYLTGSSPERVFAQCVSGSNCGMPDQDNVAITVYFSNGSVGQIAYLACGDQLLGKERVEIFGGGHSFVIDDFRTGEHYVRGKCVRLRLPGKGHREEVEAFLGAIQGGLASPISLESLTRTAATTFAIIYSLWTGMPQPIPSADTGREVMRYGVESGARTL